MNRSGLYLSAIFLSPVIGWPGNVPPYLLECPDADKAIIDDFPLPKGLTPERVYQDIWRDRIAQSDSESEFSCNVYAAPWITRKDTAFVVFLETTVYFEHESALKRDHRRVRLGLYRRDSLGYPVAEAASKPLEFGYNEKISNPDLETYPLTENHYAFGIRTEAHYFGAHYEEGHNSSLRLYRIEGATIEPILSTLTSSSCHWISDNQELHKDGGSAAIASSKRKTKGVYDLKKSAGGKKSCVFKWTGSDYELVGRDPVQDVN